MPLGRRWHTLSALNLYEIHIGVCATPNAWPLSDRVPNRDRITAARAKPAAWTSGAFHNRIFVDFGNPPGVAVAVVPRIGERLTLGVLRGSSAQVGLADSRS